MIFMSQSGLTDDGPKVEWDRWYQEHLRIMVTVPGIHSAQRFETVNPDWAPSLAMYTVASAAVFEDHYYRQVRGMGAWYPLIDRRFYRRTLFDGLRNAPVVTSASVLAVTDQRRKWESLQGISFLWLDAVGLDEAMPYRGIAVIPSDNAQRLAALSDVAVYRPVTPRYTAQVLR